MLLKEKSVPAETSDELSSLRSLLVWEPRRRLTSTRGAARLNCMPGPSGNSGEGVESFCSAVNGVGRSFLNSTCAELCRPQSGIDDAARTRIQIREDRNGIGTDIRVIPNRADRYVPFTGYHCRLLTTGRGPIRVLREQECTGEGLPGAMEQARSL